MVLTLFVYVLEPQLLLDLCRTLVHLEFCIRLECQIVLIVDFNFVFIFRIATGFVALVKCDKLACPWQYGG